MKFWQIIDDSFVGKFIGRRVKIIGETDPQRIYVENIRSFYHVPTKVAKFFCDAAVKEHVFKKRIGVYCPQCGKLIMHVEEENELPNLVTCDNCIAMEENKAAFSRNQYKTMDFYQLNPLNND